MLDSFICAKPIVSTHELECNSEFVTLYITKLFISMNFIKVQLRFNSSTNLIVWIIHKGTEHRLQTVINFHFLACAPKCHQVLLKFHYLTKYFIMHAQHFAVQSNYWIWRFNWLFWYLWLMHHLQFVCQTLLKLAWKEFHISSRVLTTKNVNSESDFIKLFLRCATMETVFFFFSFLCLVPL